MTSIAALTSQVLASRFRSQLTDWGVKIRGPVGAGSGSESEEVEVGVSVAETTAVAIMGVVWGDIVLVLVLLLSGIDVGIVVVVEYLLLIDAFDVADEILAVYDALCF